MNFALVTGSLSALGAVVRVVQLYSAGYYLYVKGDKIMKGEATSTAEKVNIAAKVVFVGATAAAGVSCVAPALASAFEGAEGAYAILNPISGIACVAQRAAQKAEDVLDHGREVDMSLVAFGIDVTGQAVGEVMIAHAAFGAVGYSKEALENFTLIRNLGAQGVLETVFLPAMTKMAIPAGAYANKHFRRAVDWAYGNRNPAGEPPPPPPPGPDGGVPPPLAAPPQVPPVVAQDLQRLEQEGQLGLQRAARGLTREHIEALFTAFESEIPGPFQEDEMLSTFTDFISRKAIRFPVHLDGNYTAFYERATLEQWIREHPDTPVPGDPAPRRTLEEIRPNVPLQSIIDTRIEKIKLDIASLRIVEGPLGSNPGGVIPPAAPAQILPVVAQDLPRLQQEDQSGLQRVIRGLTRERMRQLLNGFESEIPAEFQEDEVLSANMDSISGRSIRFPVRLEGNHTALYERETLKRWIANHPGKPVEGDGASCRSLGEIIFNVYLQRLINARIEEIKSAIAANMSIVNNIPASV